MVKSTSCCDGDEDDSNALADGCCKDENLVLKNNPDFTLKQFNNYDLVKTFCDLFYVSLPFSTTIFETQPSFNLAYTQTPPPKLQNSLVISTSVLKI